MAMNKWECEHPGCTTTAVGTGGGVGLRAVGWWVEDGGQMLCPAHRPDRAPCHDNDTNAGQACALCTAEREAYEHQEVIRMTLGMQAGTLPRWLDKRPAAPAAPRASFVCGPAQIGWPL